MNDKAKIEGILLVSGSKGISVVEIKKMFDNKTADDIKEIIKEISKKYENDDECGFTIKVFGNTFYLLTKSNLKNDIEKVVTNYRKTPLTPAIMEILSIIAYNSPCTISTVENIRGTSADNIIKKLES
jgi:segregation and condensation protein B